MFKKNTRKRLLAGALATVMMLTMCPSWALADAEDIATTQPLVDENRPVAESAPVEADTTETPAVPTPSETEVKPAENQNTAPAPSDDEANGGTDSTETGNSTNPTVSEGSENNSQKNDAVNSSPDVNDQPQDAADIKDVSMASLGVDAYSLNNVKTFEAQYWITNAKAKDSNREWKLEIASNREGITAPNGLAITDIVPNERAAKTTDGSYNTVFWQARVHGALHHQTTGPNDDKTKDGTEITRIRYKDGEFECYAKDSSEWTKFNTWTDQLVFYYLIRTDYSEMVQIDVSDWTVDKEQTQHLNRRSVTYQVIVDGGDDNGKVLDSKKFWYNKAFTVSSVRVRQTESEHYTINRVELDPSAMGTVTDTDVSGEYRFSLDLTKAKRDNATVKIYVKPNVDPHQLTYKLNGGEITSEAGTYTPEGLVYPDAPVITPTAEKTDCVFAGWYTDEALTQKWTGTKMPNENLTLYACFTPQQAPNPNPDPELTEARYFVLLPNRGKPDDNHDQGEEFYLPSSKSNGGVDGLDQSTGYVGSLTQKGANAVPHKGDSVTNIATGFSDEYLNVPSNLGFFDKKKWANGTYNGNSANTDILGENFNVHNISIVWYTIKNQGIKDGKLDIHVDGYVAGAPVKVTYHPNYGTIPGMSAADYVVPATSGDTHIVRENMFTIPNGYTFGGWYVDGTKYEVGSDHLLMTSLDLYAKWVPINSEVSYFYQNEQGTEMRFGDIDTYAFGDDVTVRTAHPEKEGYTFT